jgi:hypothetical protein
MRRFESDVIVEEPGTGPVWQFISESVMHPAAFLKSTRTDMFNILFNSGVNTVVGRYLGLYEMPEDRVYWARFRDREGLVAMVLHIFEQSPAMAVSNVVFGIAWILFLILSVYGLILLTRMRPIYPWVRFVLISILAYVFMLSFLARNVRWDMRAPVEFVLCIGFVVGLFVRPRRRDGGVASTGPEPAE